MSSSTPKSKWLGRLPSLMRRTSEVFTIPRPASAASERDIDYSSLSGSTRGREPSTPNSPLLPSVVTPPESHLHEVVPEIVQVGPSPLAQPITSSGIVRPTFPPLVEETQGQFISPVIDSTVANPGAFTGVIDDLQPVIIRDPQTVASYFVEPSPVNVVYPEPDLGHREELEALDDDDAVAVATDRERQEPLQKIDPILIPVPVPVPVPHYDMPSYPMNLGSEVWDGEHDYGTYYPSSVPVVNPSSEDVKSVERSPAPSIRMPFTDPFADPIAPRIIETDETLPLLSRPGTPPKHKPTSYLQTSAHPHSRNFVSDSPLLHSASQSTTSDKNINSRSPSAHPRLHTLGWLEYHLPDGTVYYVHPTSRVTTDINLRSERMLTGVERFLTDSGSAMKGTLASGGEIWLKDVGTAKSGLVLERWWVDHRLRTVVKDVDEHEPGLKGGAVVSQEDQLNTEYRYWSFMEAYPAHNSLPAKAKMEAMDVLTWAWTDRLLPSDHAVPAPFNQEECQELMTLIRSFGDDNHDDHGIQTRVVSRVLIRVAQWRQTYFHGNDNDISHDPSADPIAPRITQPVLDIPQSEFADNYQQEPIETHSHSPIAIPPPYIVDQCASSMSSSKNGSTGNLIETDETLSLSRPGTPSKNEPTSHLQTSAHPQSRNLVSNTPLVYSASQSTTSDKNINSRSPSAHPRLHTLGWLEYHLPDGTVYYVHPTSRVTTDINLRSERMLTGVERFLADSGSAMKGTLASSGEIWLKDVGTAKSGLVLERWWVDHRLRTVVKDVDEHEPGLKGDAVDSEEDHLSIECRYWSFMEAYPAHNPLPAKAKTEAMDVLTWAWTESLLPSVHAVPAPFSQEECQELMTLIRSFGDDRDDHGIHIRIVSRVLIRVAQWRQTHFHGNANDISHDPSADPIAPGITQPVLDIPQSEFADNYQQEPIGTHSHSPIAIPLPYIVDQCASSMSSSKNGSTGNLIETEPEFTGNCDQGPAGVHSLSPIDNPLPSFADRIASIPIHHAPYISRLKNGYTRNSIETRKSLSLLSRPAKPFKHIPSSYFKTCPYDPVSISPPVYFASKSTTSNGNINSSPSAHPRLQTLGWLEYHLPNGTVYYVHPMNRVITEINLTSESMLTSVERFLADSGNAMEEKLASGGEIWLRDVGTAKSGLVLEGWLVDHQLRTVVIGGDEHVHATKESGNDKAKNVSSEEDQLDTEFRYWSFMDAHPAHKSLPAEAKIGAMEVLRWAWTERHFPSHRAIPSPFTQEEGQELMTLIRSFDDDYASDDHGIQTRIVSRVFLEVAHWRQTYFRPNKPLPTNVGSNQSCLPMAPRQPFKWVIIDFVISCLFLLCIFFGRTCLSTRIIDGESGCGIFVLGACTCFVAWTLSRGLLLLWWISSWPRFRRHRRW